MLGRSRGYKTFNAEPFSEDVKASLTSDQFNCTILFGTDFMASQMSDCIQKTTQAEISAKEYIFKGVGILC